MVQRAAEAFPQRAMALIPQVRETKKRVRRIRLREQRRMQALRVAHLSTFGARRSKNLQISWPRQGPKLKSF